uniref:Uncharacterized protein n=1 Tax=Arsenophonus endosymbiont of Trialeurodes vaporariorum TaxID=235567 RepID=A0A3B0MKD2_9GAMM
MITATEAKVMSNYEVREHLEFIQAAIIYAARDRRHEVIIRTYPYCIYFDGGAYHETAQKVISTLRNNGFKVEGYYCEHQFIDNGLYIVWGAE